MADFLKNILGGSSPSPVPTPAEDADFADFAGAPQPEPASISPVPSGSTLGSTFPTGSPLAGRPYTKWYRVWERTTIQDFYSELFILPFVLFIVIIHFWGAGTNKKKARGWITAHQPILAQEFSHLGFKRPKSSGAVEAELVKPEDLLKEKTAADFTTYATGRANVAFVDIKLTYIKRYNPALRVGEAVIGLFFESMPPTQEHLEATIYAFDGKENSLLPGTEKGSVKNSTFDGFVFAVVHKDAMKKLRDERYDLSLTTTKDNAKLPVWASTMSEGNEITEAILTPDLIKAIEAAGEAFIALIVTDMPVEKPTKLDELVPKKRIELQLQLPSGTSAESFRPTLSIFEHFLRLPDHLVSNAHFRPEALRRVRETREVETKKIRKVDEGEKAEERKLKADKAKKEKRDADLRGLNAEEQRKYLEKEREKDMRKKQKRSTVKA